MAYGITDSNQKYSALKWACFVLYGLSSSSMFAAMGFFSRRVRLFRNRLLASVVFFIHTLMLVWVFNLQMGYVLASNLFAMLPLWLGTKMQVIGLTGGIATGKSSVSRILAAEDFKIIDADQISKDLRKHDKHYQSLLIQTFGEEIWNKEKQEIDSEKLGKIIFSDPNKRR